MIKVNNQEWEREISATILKAYLIEQIEDGCAEYMIQTDRITDKLKELGFIKEEGFFDGIPTTFFNENNLEVLFEFINNADIKSIHINENRDIKVELNNGIVLNMEVF